MGITSFLLGSKYMNKSGLIEVFVEELKFPFITGSSIINTILDAMTEALVKGENIKLRGFGTFSVRQYDSYTCKNPKTGGEAIVKARKLPFFKARKELKEAMNAGRE